MLSLIEVTCPHCGAHGQIMLPPLGSIIVGPCPECDEMVTVFCGRVLPLDKVIMTYGAEEERKEHLMETIGTFVDERLERLFAHNPPSAPLDEGGGDFEEEFAAEGEEMAPEPPEKRISLFGNRPKAPITQEEIGSFVTVDLNLLDNGDYFHAVFD